MDVITIKANVAITMYVFIIQLISFHFCLRNVAVMSLPTSRAVPITMIEIPPPTNNILSPTMLKYAPQADIAIALNNTKNAKNVIVYNYKCTLKKQPHISVGLLGAADPATLHQSVFIQELTPI